MATVSNMLRSREASPSEVEHHYTAMGHSVDLVDSILNNTYVHSLTENEKRVTVERNVEHLEIMLECDFWGERNLDLFRDAVSRGRAWLA